MKPNKIIIKNAKNYELHFGYCDEYHGSLEEMFYQTIKDLIPYLEELIKWKDLGVSYSLEVDTNREDIERLTVVKFEIARFVHYTDAYNDLFKIW